VNQWTLLIGSLPLAYSISGGSISPLDFDGRQSEEVFLTAAQSLFAVAILVSLSVSRWEALLLAAMFVTQFAFTDTSIRVGYAVVYCMVATIVLVRDIPFMRSFWSAARESWQAPRERPASGPAPPG
jgi:cation:H+ antiporter